MLISFVRLMKFWCDDDWASACKKPSVLCHVLGKIENGFDEIVVINGSCSKKQPFVPSRASHPMMRLFAPLTIEADTLNQGLAILGDCLAHC